MAFEASALSTCRTLTTPDYANILLKCLLITQCTRILIHSFIPGNPLSCNCRLSWIYLLRNETKDSTLKHALEKISCVADPIDKHPEDNNEIDENTLADENYEYYDKGEEDGSKEKLKAKLTKLVDIPLETLPCPKELMQSIDESYGHPIQNEIRLKAYSNVASVAPSLVILLMVILI